MLKQAWKGYFSVLLLLCIINVTASGLCNEPAGRSRQQGPPPTASLPQGFPPDIPLYPDSFQHATVKAPTGVLMVKLKSKDSPEQIARFYRTHLSRTGWKERPQMVTPLGGVVLSFRRADDSLSVQITPQRDATGISLNLMKIK